MGCQAPALDRVLTFDESQIVALEPGVVDFVEARALDPPDFPMPDPPHRCVTPGRLFPEKLDDGENQARCPDDVADPARKLVRHSRCLPNIKPAMRAGHVRGRSEGCVKSDLATSPF
jgi:hypothetical protein